MEYMELNNGIQMPMLGFGTYSITRTWGVDTIVQAIQAGYRLIDTARMYHNEEIVGEAINSKSSHCNALTKMPGGAELKRERYK